MRYRGIEDFGDAPRQVGIRRIDHGLIGVKVERQDQTPRAYHSSHLASDALRTLEIAQHARHPTQVKVLVGQLERVGIPNFKGDREIQRGGTSSRLGNHGGADVDSMQTSPRAYKWRQALELVPQPATNVKHVVADAHRVLLEHPLRKRLNHGARAR